jgi:transcriptional regulator with XRE-family HTH domain
MAADNLLGDFLKARRAQVAPTAAAEPTGGRRRVAGLRREELARLAGISEPYLVRLEQGVDRHPSPQVLRSLVRALQLDADAAAHLHALVAPDLGPDLAPDPDPDPDPDPAPPPRPEVSAEVRRLLDAWTDRPAYVRDRCFDVLAANRQARALAPMYQPGRNLVREVFLDPAARRLFPDWGQVAAQTAAALRAEADPRDPRTARLVAELEEDAEFRRLWTRHEARPVRDELKRFAHPVVGGLALRRQTLAVAGTGAGDGRQVIIVYQAPPGSPSEAALARLAR